MTKNHPIVKLLMTVFTTGITKRSKILISMTKYIFTITKSKLLKLMMIKKGMLYMIMKNQSIINTKIKKLKQ